MFSLRRRKLKKMEKHFHIRFVFLARVCIKCATFYCSFFFCAKDEIVYEWIHFIFFVYLPWMAFAYFSNCHSMFLSVIRTKSPFKLDLRSKIIKIGQTIENISKNGAGQTDYSNVHMSKNIFCWHHVKWMHLLALKSLNKFICAKKGFVKFKIEEEKNSKTRFLENRRRTNEEKKMIYF